MPKKETKKTNVTKTQSTSDRHHKTELDVRKEALHRMIDNITPADYVEFTSKWIDIAGKPSMVHLLTVEKEGNILISPADRKHIFDPDLDD